MTWVSRESNKCAIDPFARNIHIPSNMYIFLRAWRFLQIQ